MKAWPWCCFAFWKLHCAPYETFVSAIVFPVKIPWVLYAVQSVGSRGHSLGTRANGMQSLACSGRPVSHNSNAVIDDDHLWPVSSLQCYFSSLNIFTGIRRDLKFHFLLFHYWPWLFISVHSCLYPLPFMEFYWSHYMCPVKISISEAFCKFGLSERLSVRACVCAHAYQIKQALFTISCLA